MHDLGGDTRDHIALGIPHPIEHGLPESDQETHIRHRSTHKLWAGTLLLVTDITTALALMTYAHNRHWDDPVTRQFVGLIIILVGLGATTLINAALTERQQRQQRTLIRRAMARADANAGLGDANRQAIETNNRLVAEAIATLAGIEKRLLALETAVEQVPGYADGLERGARVAAAVLGIDDNGNS